MRQSRRTAPDGAARLAAALGLEPLDEHNRRLLDHAHPVHWTHPPTRERYHLVVIGGGTGGLASASSAAAAGARVALIERDLMGGECLNTACVPSKAIIGAARSWHAAALSRAHYGGPAVSGAGDFAAAMERMRRLRAALSAHDGAPRFSDLGVDVFFGTGHFTTGDAVAVDGRVLRFRRAIIATGARPRVPAISGLDDVGYYTTETFFNLTELPPRLLVIGGGPAGCELAQAFARLGSRVTLLHRRRQLLPREDADAAALVRRALEREGVALQLGTNVVRAEATGPEKWLVTERDGRELAVPGDVILVTTGRTPNLETLDLETAGVRYGTDGIVTDDRLRTTNPRVYAVGDVRGRHGFTHAADAHARIAVRNALFFGRERASTLVIPRATYTSPELAHVGMSAGEARAAGRDIDTLTIPLSVVDRAVLDGETEGFLRIHLKRGGNRILGATLVADRAGEMIASIVLAITNRIGLDAIGRTILPYPTHAEVLRAAATAHSGRRLTPTVRGLLALFFKVFR